MWCAPAADPRALAQLQHRLLRGRPVAAGAGDEDLRLRRAPAPSARERRLDGVRQPRDVLAAQRGDRRDRARVARGVAPRLLDLGRARRSTSSASSASGESAAPVTSHFGPENARAASSVSGVSPSCETQTMQVGVGRREHGLERLHRPPAGLRRVERGAAAGEDDARAVRQPPVAGTARSHSGCASTARRVSPGIALSSIPSAPCPSSNATTLDERAARPHRTAAARAVGRLLRHARRRLALRARREPRHRALRRAHVLQGHRAAAELARPDDADRRHRRRVQRLHLARSTRATTSAAPAPTATPRSTSCSTCSATPSSTPRRSSARRA